jgi:N-acetyl-gamma-glutamyl-phosphate reductase
MPAVGNFRQGMLVQLPLHLDLLPGKPPTAQACTTRCWQAHYAGSDWVHRRSRPRPDAASWMPWP